MHINEYVHKSASVPAVSFTYSGSQLKANSASGKKLALGC